MSIFTFDLIKQRIINVLQVENVPAEHAQLLAQRIMQAERDGTLSHGLMRLPDYLASLRAGWVKADAQPKVLPQQSPFVQVEGDNGFAQVAAELAQPEMLKRIEKYGIAMLNVRNAHHIGALWTDIENYAEQGWVAFNFVNSRQRLAPYGASRPLLGTNAMAFAFPDGQGNVLGWDQASSVMSLGEVKQHALRGQPLPLGVGLDAQGNPTTEPDAVMRGGTVLPFGEHKGSGIALMVEIMAAAITGARFGYEDQSGSYPGAASSNAGQTLMVINPAFSSTTPFATRIKELIAHLHTDAELRLPGERRQQQRHYHTQSGFILNEASAELLGLISDITTEARGKGQR